MIAVITFIFGYDVAAKDGGIGIDTSLGEQFLYRQSRHTSTCSAVETPYPCRCCSCCIHQDIRLAYSFPSLPILSATGG